MPTFVTVLKFNPYHDARGRFTSKGGGPAGAAARADRVTAATASRDAAHAEASSALSDFHSAARAAGVADAKILNLANSFVNVNRHPSGSRERMNALDAAREAARAAVPAGTDSVALYNFIGTGSHLRRTDSRLKEAVEGLRRAENDVGAANVSNWASHGTPKKLAEAMANPTQRKAIVTAAFKKLADDGIQISVDGDTATPAAAAAKWERLTNGASVTPAELVTALTGINSHISANRHDEDGVLSVDMRGHVINVDGTGINVYGTKVDSISREFNFNNKDVYHNFLEVREGEQGGGMGRKLFRNSIPVYQRLGFKSVSVTANLDAGGYVWGRFGFTSRDGSAIGTLGDKAMGGLVRDFPSANVLNKKERAEYDAISELVVNAQEKITSSNKADRAVASYFANAITSLKTPHLAKRLGMTKTDKKGRVSGHPRKLMQKWLKNSNWHGELNFDDARAMRTLGRYAGIRPKRQRRARAP